MRCGKAQQFVSTDLDGQLDPRRRTAVHQHLANCPACQRFSRQVRQLSETLSAAPALEPSPDFASRLMARMPARPQHLTVREWLATTGPAPLASGLLGLAAGVAMALMVSGQRPMPASTTVAPSPDVYAESLDPLPDGSAAAQYVALVREGGR